MKKSLIKIDPDKIALLVEESGKFIFKPQAEEQIIELLKAKEMLEQAIENVKERIVKSGRTISPNFRGVKGSRIDCTLRSYGSRYLYDFQHDEDCEAFLRHKMITSVDADSVDRFYKEMGTLPEGITEAPREDKLTITMREI